MVLLFYMALHGFIWLYGHKSHLAYAYFQIDQFLYILLEKKQITVSSSPPSDNSFLGDRLRS